MSTHTQRAVEQLAADVDRLPPAEQLEIASQLVKQERRDLVRVGWAIAGRIVDQYRAAEALAALDRRFPR